MKVKIESEVAQSCPTLRDPMDCSLSGSSVHEIFQARVLEWVAIAFSKIEYYIAIKIMTFATCRNMMNLTDILSNKINQNEKTACFDVQFK